MQTAQKEKMTAPIGEQDNFFIMYYPMYQYLLQTALQLSTVVRESERNAIESQS